MLHAAGSGEHDWQDALDAVMTNVGAGTASLYTSTPARFVERLATPGFTPEAIRLYAEHYHQHDLWAAHGRYRSHHSPRLKAVLGEEFISPSEFKNTPMWNDFLRHHGGGFHLVGAAFPIEGGNYALLGLHRPYERRAFDEHERLRLDHLLTHLRMALRVRSRLAQADLGRVVGLAALEALRAPAFVTDTEARLLFANAAATAMTADISGPLRLRRRDGAVPGSILTAAHRDEEARFARLIATTAQGGPGGGLRLSTKEGGPSPVILVSPLPTGLSSVAGAVDPGVQPGLALIISRDPAAQPILSSDLLKRVFGLSPSESIIAIALANGTTAETVAAQRRATTATVRTQIRHILEKTGSANLRALTRLLASL